MACGHFCEDLKADIQQADGSVLLDFICFSSFRQYGYDTKIETELRQVTRVQIMKHVQQVTFDDFPKMLVELSREAFWAWCFVVFHVKNRFPNILFS